MHGYLLCTPERTVMDAKKKKTVFLISVLHMMLRLRSVLSLGAYVGWELQVTLQRSDNVCPSAR